MSSVLFIFLDGIGLGPVASNPLASNWPGFQALSGGRAWTDTADHIDSNEAVFRGIDACLGVEGLPQSGTGQASLLTGENCAALAGRHYGPFPHSTSRPVLREHSLFARLGPERSAFANAFPPRFFELVGKRDRWSVTTRSCLDAGVRIRTLEDLVAGTGLAADVTGEGLRRGLHLEIPEISEAGAAAALSALAAENAFTLFEVFHTDKAGHAMDADAAALILGRIDRMLTALLAVLPESVTVLVTSDHGNLEDLSVKTHTRNPVPMAAFGRDAKCFRNVTDLTGIADAVIDVVSTDR